MPFAFDDVGLQLLVKLKNRSVGWDNRRLQTPEEVLAAKNLAHRLDYKWI